MRRMSEEAYAKINLTLDVLRRREDGYHEMEMVMQSVDLSDTLTITLEDTPGVRVRGNRRGVPDDATNLAYQAGEAYLRHAELHGKGLSIDINKRIPVQAGTAGGSSDAAATLRCVNRMSGKHLPVEELLEIGAEVGSDVPFCVLGGTALARGRGEKVTPIWSIPDCWIVLCKPNFDISSPELFKSLDENPPTKHPNTRAMLEALKAGDLLEIAKNLHNVFEDVLPHEQWEEVIAIRRIMTEVGALGSCMSGTGPTVFGLFETEEKAHAAWRALRRYYRVIFITKPV